MKLFVILSSVIALSLSCGKHYTTTQVALSDSGNMEAGGEVVLVPEEKVSFAPDYKSRAYETVYFNYDSADLKSDVDAIRATDTAVEMQQTGQAVLLEGHCDERGTIEYNLALGERRGLAVARYLRSMGVDREKIRVISYGKERPVAEGHDESAWAKNRRVEFVKE